MKVTLQTEKVRAKSVTMLRKELATSIIAYNLVQQVCRLAAQQTGIKPRRLSFTGVWTAVRIILLESHQWIDLTPAQWHAKFQLTLNIAQQKNSRSVLTAAIQDRLSQNAQNQPAELERPNPMQQK